MFVPGRVQHARDDEDEEGFREAQQLFEQKYNKLDTEGGILRVVYPDGSYIDWEVRDVTGGERLIHAPKRRLKEVLRKLDRLLVRKLPKSEHAHGFMRGRSIASNAAKGSIGSS